MRTAMLFFILIGAATADEWPRFRGPNGSGLSPDRTIPTHWTEKDFAWRVEVPGIGHSSPVVWGQRIFLTSSDRKSGKRLVLAYDLGSGKLLWKKEQDGGKYRTHAANSFATATPAVDAQRLYTLWATPKECTALVFDHDGKELWKASLGSYESKHGFGISPIVQEGLLIVHVQPDGAGRVIALDVKDGKQRWSLPRAGKNATYATPCVRGDEVIVTNWQHGITGIGLRDGRLRWEKSVFDTTSQQRSIASPVVAGDLVLGICGFADGAKRLVALRPGEKPVVAWRYEATVPQMATPLVMGERVFLATEKGFGVWLDRQTGREVWKKRLNGPCHASPIAIGERIYCATTRGKMLILEAKDDSGAVVECPLGEGTQATPAVAEGRLIVRTDSALWCLAGKR